MAADNEEVTRVFRNKIEYKDMGTNAQGILVHTVIRLPKRMVREMGLKPTERCRIKGTLDGRHDISCALNPDPESTQYMIISKKLLKTLKKDVGDEVEVEFQRQSANSVDVPDDLQRKLNSKAALLRKWNALTAGKQRTWAVYVDKAKLQGTRSKRIHEIMIRLQTGNLDPKVPVT